MLGAIVGDVVGSVYEHRPIKTKEFPLLTRSSRFTDDSVCTVAVADWLLAGGDPAAVLRRWCRRHPRAGYGGMFRQWIMSDDMPAYGSWGNGAPMRASPCGWLAASLDEVLAAAERATNVSHDHPEAVRGARAVAAAVWWAREGRTPGEVRRAVAGRFGYDLDATVDEIRPGYGFDVSSAGTVPPALIAAFEAEDYEDAVRNAISLGGDADTLACIAGAVAEPLFGVPPTLATAVEARLGDDMRGVLARFRARTGGTTV
ncbi:MAG TPA: ADP-ribosylglycohydrolase family protein [Geminicoccaceae bacterium]|nr:ADP-ribosylglycohydrolase family protein [Geminicoccaceae bacterium]